MLHFILSFFILLLPFSFAKAQPSAISELRANPRAYVEKNAVETNLIQIEKQNEINSIQNSIKEIQKSILQEKNKLLKKQKKEELKSLHQSLALKKKELGVCIKESKKYRDLVNKSDAEILAALSSASSDLSNANGVEDNKKSNRKTGIPTYKTETTPTDTKEKANKSIEKTSSIFEYLDAKSNLNSKVPCKFQPSQSDAYKSLYPEILFTHTPPEIKQYLKGVEYYKGNAFIGKEPGYTYLNLQIEIASEQALFHYGNLGKSFIIFKLVTGEEIRIINSRFDSGTINRDKKMTTFSGIYFIEKNTEKLLLNSELDTMKLQMVTGYEYYTIYNIDFFKRQLECINTAN